MNMSVLETDIIYLLSDIELETILESINYKPICLLVVLNVATHKDTLDFEEIAYFNKYEYNIESNRYEDPAEDSNIYWVLARASEEVEKAKFISKLDNSNTREAAGIAARIAIFKYWKQAKELFEIIYMLVEKFKKQQSSSKTVQKSKVHIMVKKATGKRMII
ncbi:hypothetical protein BDZ91DRAFT_803805 [Kalaharituber pfeilii]|nr:hypothetical protein BDZ91DRAFT_803805 [Kalaharituber pfeilii]